MNFTARNTQYLLISNQSQYKLMSSILERPAFHYGIPIIQAIIVAVIGFTMFSGVARLFALALAGIAIVVVPQILKRAA